MTPTPPPPPTPYIDWATPTPYSVPVGTPEFSLLGSGGTSPFVTIAEQGVQTWQMANSSSAMDNMLTILIVLMVLWGLRRVVKEIRTDND